jgi:hypothetical protein
MRLKHCAVIAALEVGCALLALLFSREAVAQNNATADPRIAQPERPTVATHAHTVAPGYAEVETGVQGLHPEAGETEYDTPSLLKLGVTGRLQLDVYEGTTTLRQSNATSFGIGDLSIGCKWRLLDDARLLGDFAVQPTLKFPTGSVAKSSGTGTTDFGFLAISSHAFGPVSMDVNVGYTWRSGDGSVVPVRAMLWTVSGGLSVSGNLGWAVEIFGLPGTVGGSGQAPVIAFLNGPTFALRRWLVLDCGGILKLAGPQATVLYAGLTWNLGQVPWR